MDGSFRQIHFRVDVVLFSRVPFRGLAAWLGPSGSGLIVYAQTFETPILFGTSVLLSRFLYMNL